MARFATRVVGGVEAWRAVTVSIGSMFGSKLLMVSRVFSGPQEATDKVRPSNEFTERAILINSRKKLSDVSGTCGNSNAIIMLMEQRRNFKQQQF